MVVLGHRGDDRLGAAWSTAGVQDNVAHVVLYFIIIGGIDIVWVVIIVGIHHLIAGRDVSSELGRTTIGAVTAVDGKEHVAVTVPGKRGVERDYLPVVVGKVAGAVGHHLYELVVGVGMDEVVGEHAFTDVGHVDVHTCVVGAVAGSRVDGLEAKSGDVTTKVTAKEIKTMMDIGILV